MNTFSVTSPWKPGAGSHQALNSHHPAGAGRTVDAHSVCRGWGGPSGAPWVEAADGQHNHTQPETQSKVCNVPADQRKTRRSHSEVPTTGSKPRERRPVSEGCWRRTKAVRPAGTRGGGCLRRGPGPEGRRPPGARAGGWRRQGCGEAGTAAELGEAGSSGDVAAGEAAPGRENRTHQGHFHRQGPEPRRHPHRLCSEEGPRLYLSSPSPTSSARQRYLGFVKDVLHLNPRCLLRVSSLRRPQRSVFARKRQTCPGSSFLGSFSNYPDGSVSFPLILFLFSPLFILLFYFLSF